jgi:lysozyme
MTINLRVLDLSHHNDGPNGGPIDFKKLYDFGIRGIIHKSSQGVGNIDPMYGRRRQAAADAGLRWGAYHFADGSDPVAQAKHFLAVAAAENDTLLALDFEPNGHNTMTLDGARKFLLAVDAEIGRKAVIYSGNLIKETLGNKPDPFFAAHRFWLAHYNNKPSWPKAWPKPWLHQFSGDGVNANGIRVPGVNANQAGKLDMNSFDGQDEDLQNEWAC